MRSVACVLVFCLLVTLPAVADTVVLLDGSAVEGTVVDRESVRAHPVAQLYVSVVSSGSSEVLKLGLGEIDYMMLEDYATTQTIRFRKLRSGGFAAEKLPVSPIRDGTPGVLRASRKSNAAVLIGVGAGALALGALKKFGGEKVTATEDSASYEKESYNGFNYVLMVGGGAALVVGLTMHATNSTSLGSNHAMLVVEPSVAPLSRTPGVAVSLRF